jgi:acyl carrier protein
MSSGRVDSLGTINLMMFLEKQFSLDTADPDFDPALLEFVDKIMLMLSDRP